MKFVSKIAIILIALISINISFIGVADAATLDSVTNEASGFVNEGKKQLDNMLASGGGDVTGDIVTKLNPIAQALRTIGIGVILCVGAFMGIKWVTAKPDEQAKLKQQSVGLLVAAIVVIGAFTIWSIALKIVSQL